MATSRKPWAAIRTSKRGVWPAGLRSHGCLETDGIGNVSKTPSIGSLSGDC
jgi:hypothetical protein